MIGLLCNTDGHKELLCDVELYLRWDIMEKTVPSMKQLSLVFKNLLNYDIHHFSLVHPFSNLIQKTRWRTKDSQREDLKGQVIGRDGRKKWPGQRLGKKLNMIGTAYSLELVCDVACIVVKTTNVDTAWVCVIKEIDAEPSLHFWISLCSAAVGHAVTRSSAACWAPTVQQSIGISCPPGTQQRTRRTLLKRSIDATNRLQRRKLPTLKYRRLRGDMIEVFKITHNIYDPDVSLK